MFFNINSNRETPPPHHRNNNNQPLTKLQQENYPELVALQGIFQNVNSKNWQDRRDNLTSLCDSFLQNYELFQRANKLEKCLEVFLEHFEDGSVKVYIYTYV